MRFGRITKPQTQVGITDISVLCATAARELLRRFAIRSAAKSDLFFLLLLLVSLALLQLSAAMRSEQYSVLFGICIVTVLVPSILCSQTPKRLASRFLVLSFCLSFANYRSMLPTDSVVAFKGTRVRQFSGRILKRESSRTVGSLMLTVMEGEKKILIRIPDLPWESTSALCAGNVVRGYGRFRSTGSAKDAGASVFGYPQHLSRAGYSMYSVSSAYLSSVGQTKAGDSCTGDSLARSWQDRLTRRLSAGHTYAEARSVLAALAFGSKQGLAEHTVHLFRSLGLSHVLVISGFHVALVYASLRALARVMWQRSETLVILCSARIPGNSFALCGALLYVWLSGFTIPAVRAIVVLLLTYVCSLWGRRFTALRSLILCCLVLSLLWPLVFLTVAFQLSFSALIGIYLAARLMRKTEGGRTVGRPNTCGRYVRQSYVLSYCAWAFTTPFVCFWFADVSLLAPVWNVVFIPFLCGIFVFLGIPLLMMSYLNPSFFEPLLELCLSLGATLLTLMAGASSLTQIVETEFTAALLVGQLLLLLFFIRQERDAR